LVFEAVYFTAVNRVIANYPFYECGEACFNFNLRRIFNKGLTIKMSKNKPRASAIRQTHIAIMIDTWKANSTSLNA
jgi:hypothetical protein